MKHWETVAALEAVLDGKSTQDFRLYEAEARKSMAICGFRPAEIDKELGPEGDRALAQLVAMMIVDPDQFIRFFKATRAKFNGRN